jgi:DNA-binding beta-propeller fold protein YncE
MFVVGDAGNEVNEYSLSTAFDVSTASYVTLKSVSAETSPSGMSFNNDGTKMFIIGYNSDHVSEYDLTTAFDINTASYAGNAERFSVYSQESYPTEWHLIMMERRCMLLVQIMMR